MTKGFQRINTISVIPGHTTGVVLLNVHAESLEDVIKGLNPLHMGVVPEILLDPGITFWGYISLVLVLPEHTVSIKLGTPKCVCNIVGWLRVDSDPSEHRNAF